MIELSPNERHDVEPARWNVAAEQTVLGCILRKPDLIDQLPTEMCADDFTARHKLIYQACVEMFTNGQAVDVITVCERVGEEQFEYVADLAGNAVSYSNLQAYTKIILDHSLSRRIEKISSDLALLAYSNADAKDKIGEVNQRIAELEATSPEEEGEQVNDVLKAAIDAIDKRFHGLEDPGLPTGFKDLDEKILGLAPGDFVIVAGRPSMGKTTLAMNIARHNILQEKNVLVFSLETTSIKLMDRMLSDIGKIPLQHIKTGKLTEEDWPKLEFAARRLKDKNFTLLDMPDLHIRRAQAIVRKMNRKKKVDLIVVDYLQLMRGEGENETLRLADVSRGLFAMAKQIGAPVIAVAQINRGTEKQSNKRPTIADIRQSGQIEQDATAILMLYRDEYYNEDSMEKGIAEVIIGKQKDGETGTVRLASKLHHNSFEDLGDYKPPEPPAPYNPYAKGGLP